MIKKLFGVGKEEIPELDERDITVFTYDLAIPNAAVRMTLLHNPTGLAVTDDGTRYVVRSRYRLKRLLLKELSERVHEYHKSNPE